MDFEIKRKNGLYTIIAYLVIFNLLGYFISSLIATILKSFNVDLTNKENAYTATSFINLFIYLIMFVVLILIYKKDLLTDIKPFFKNKASNILLIILGSYGIFYVINGFVTVLVQSAEANINYISDFYMMPPFEQLLKVSSTATNQTDIEAILKSNGFIFMFLSAGIFGPICEELVFRKAFFDLCKTKEMGIFLSSLCFGLIHITSSVGYFDGVSLLLMTIPYVVSGVAFGYIYIKNDCNIVVPTIVHMLSNIISMIGIMFII